MVALAEDKLIRPNNNRERVCVCKEGLCAFLSGVYANTYYVHRKNTITMFLEIVNEVNH